MSTTHYSVLGISPGATTDEIKKAYRSLARTHHPDKAKDAEEKARFEDLFAAVTTAYNVLKDDASRAAYDATIAPEQPEADSASTAPPPGVPGAPGAAAAGAAVGIDLEKGRREIALRAYAQGVKLYQLGDYAKASEFLRSAAQNNPGEAQFQDRLAVCLLRCKRNFSEAVQAATRASELDPYKVEYRLHLAELYEAIGSKDKALEAYREVLKWDMNNVQAADRVRKADEEQKPMARLLAFYKKITGRD